MASELVYAVGIKRRGALISLGENVMNHSETPRGPASPLHRSGKIKYGIFAWLLGLPLPIIILALFFRGCDF